MVKRDAERKKIGKLEVIGTDEKFVIQSSFRDRFIVNSFDEPNARELKIELDEWLNDLSYKRVKKKATRQIY